MRRLEMILACLLIAATVSAQSVTPEQSARAELQIVKEQLFQATVQVAQLKAQLADMQAKYDQVTLSSQGAQLKAEHDALDIEMKKTLGGGDADIVDWTTTPPSLKKEKK